MSPRRRISDHLPWRIVPLLAYLTLATAAAYSVGKVQNNIDRIENLEQRTFQIVCLRQREGLTRLRETKAILASTNSTLVSLLANVEPATEGNRPRLRLAGERLAANNERLMRGITELDRYVALRCPKR